MKQYLKLFFTLLVFLSACQEEKNQESETQETKEEVKINKKYKTIGSIERLDPAFHELIPEEAQIEVIGKGMTWSEGPLWIAEKNMLLFSDVKENRTHKWTEAGGVEVYLEPSGFTGDSTDSREKGANGLTLDPDGKLVMCQHGDRRVARLLASWEAPKSEFETVVDNFEGKRLNSPNDLVYDSQGNLFFTDPPFGLSEAMVDDPKKELPYQGVFRLSRDGTLTLLTDQMSRPNGVALSPDEKTLYVTNSDPEKAIWMAFPLNEDGSLGQGKVFYDATDLVGKEVGFPDGLKVDTAGNIYS
ncbi:MAG: SMP-30/gluconolactonase/LRE family protein, partial [Bacteroidota bacterium]